MDDNAVGKRINNNIASWPDVSNNPSKINIDSQETAVLWYSDFSNFVYYYQLFPSQTSQMSSFSQFRREFFNPVTIIVRNQHNV